MTIQDVFKRPLTDLRISVTDRCNLRCSYCMPGHRKYQFLPRKEILTFEEIVRLTNALTTLGVEKARLTGGEPLLRRDLHLLVKALTKLPGLKETALTTNGMFFHEHGKSLRDAGLTRVTFSLDSLIPATLKKLTLHQESAEQVLRAVDYALELGLSPVKINMVVQKGVNDDEIVAMAQQAKDMGAQLRFIEFMDVGTLNGWTLDRVVTGAEILERMKAVYDFVPKPRNSNHDVANRFVYRDGGEFGVIMSVSKPFCQSCSRLRLSADGKLYTCLFGSKGTDIRPYLRSAKTDDDLQRAVSQLWSIRSDRYSQLRTETSDRERVEMFQIGG